MRKPQGVGTRSQHRGREKLTIGLGRAMASPLPVAVVTAGFLGVCLLATALFARNIGLAEDWNMVAAMLGREPDLPGWVWSQNNEHRLPVQRLLYLGLLRLTHDFRAGMVASQLMLGSLALVLAWAAARARNSRMDLGDTVFPLALLHLGHWENLFWGWQIQFVWSVTLGGVLLALVSARPGPLNVRDTILVGVLLALLPISGANGIVLGLAMAPWIAAQALDRRPLPPLDRFGGGPRALSLAAAGAAVLATGAYFTGYVSPPWSPPLATPSQFVAAAGHYFAIALGSGAGAVRWPAAIFVGAFIAGGSLLALRRMFVGPAAGAQRALGLTLFTGSGTALGLLIAVARGGYGGPMPDRYALFAALPLLGAAICWRLYAPIWGRRAVLCLAVLLVVLLPLNIHDGLSWGAWYVRGMRAVESDILDGATATDIAERHRAFLMHWNEDALRDRIGMLREAEIGPFGLHRDDVAE